MKTLKKLFIVIMSLSLTSCGFVNYVEGSSQIEQTVLDELTTKRSEYIQRLVDTYLEDNYENEEKVQLRRCLIEAKAELLECNSLSKLEEVFEKNKDIINAIKTKAQYAKELADKKEEYIAKINSISDETIYRDAEKETYNFYIEKAIEAINEIGSIKDDFDKIFNAYKNIIEAIKTDANYIKEELEAFEKYKQEAIEIVNGYVDIDDYRIEEATAIKELISTFIKDIDETEDYPDVDALVREYKTNVYPYETDKQLYDKELLSLINESKKELSSYTNPSNYRENEVSIINTLLDAFNSKVDSLGVKEEVIKLVGTYKELLDAIKTDSQLYEEEKLILIKNLFQELKAIVDYDNLSGTDKEHYDHFYETLLLLPSKEAVESSINDEKIEHYEDIVINGDMDALIPYQLCLINSLNYYLDKTLYREAQKQEINSIITSSYGTILSCTNYEDTNTAFNSVKTSLDAVLTNDEMWVAEDAQFLTTLHTLYGDDILVPEGSLTEADNYYELAKIIDYYAFYQIDADSFVRDTFRVKINWEWNSLAELLASTYWKCELVHVNCGISFKNEGDYLVVQLTPYDVASRSNEKVPITLHQSNFHYGDVDEIVPRDVDEYHFSQNPEVKGVWTTNQLWYALENNYCPLCVANSPAEQALNEMLDILNSINIDSMSDVEKAFNIFQWIGNNVEFNNYFFTDMHYENSTDIEHFPDEIPSTFRECSIDGALFDKYSVCYGYAKLMLAMLRMEGIESYILYLRANDSNLSRSINWLDNGRVHCVLVLNLDGDWFISDPSYSNMPDTSAVNYYFNCARFITSFSMFSYRISEMHLDIIDIIRQDYEIYDVYLGNIYYENGYSILFSNYDTLSSLLSDEKDYYSIMSRINIKNYVSSQTNYDIVTHFSSAGWTGMTNYLLFK